jgi:hypothetical protein
MEHGGSKADIRIKLEKEKSSQFRRFFDVSSRYDSETGKRRQIILLSIISCHLSAASRTQPSQCDAIVQRMTFK